METLKARRSWTDVLQILRDHRWQTRLLYPVQLSITLEGENITFHDKTKLKLYLSTTTVLEKVLEGKLQLQKVNYTDKNTGYK